MAGAKRACGNGTCGYDCGGGICSYAGGGIDETEAEVFRAAVSDVPPDLRADIYRRIGEARSEINAVISTLQNDFDERLPSHKLAFLENDRGRMTLGFVRVEGPATDIELDNPPDGS